MSTLTPEETPAVSVLRSFITARHHVEAAVFSLLQLRRAYELSAHPARTARIKALDAKIDALRAVQLNAQAHPWTE